MEEFDIIRDPQCENLVSGNIFDIFYSDQVIDDNSELNNIIKIDKKKYLSRLLNSSVREKNYELSKRAINSGANVSYVSSGESLLNASIDQDFFEMSKLLIMLGTKLNKKSGRCGPTLYRLAYFERNINLVELMFNYGVSMYENIDHHTCLHHCYRRKGFIKILLKYGFNDKKNIENLINSSWNIDKMRILLISKPHGITNLPSTYHLDEF